VFGDIYFFHLFPEITSLVLKKDVVGQEHGAIAKFQLTGSLLKMVHFACIVIRSEEMIQYYCKQ
jgi:hypothetical protein